MLRSDFWPVALLLGAVILAACSSGYDDDAPRPTQTSATAANSQTLTVRKGNKVRIGVSTTLTTENAQFGVPIRDTVILAVSERPQISGFDVEVVAEDDLCTGPGAEAVAQKLIAVDAVAVIGPMCASSAVAALDDYARSNLIVVSSSASHPSVTTQEATNFVRTIWNDDDEADEIAKYVVNVLGLRRIALVDDGTPRATALSAEIERVLAELAGEIVTRESIIPGSVTAELPAMIAAAAPQILVFAGSADEGAPLAQALRDAGFAGAVLGAASETIDAPWSAIEGAYVSRGVEPLTSSRDAFILAYRARYGDEAATDYTDYTYDACQLLFDAIGRVAVVDGDGNLTIDRQALIAAVKATRLENGASGTVVFTPNGDRDVAAGAVGSIYQARGGELVRVQ
jgi:branched-chain amino acid transport system substrate-binding protein